MTKTINVVQLIHPSRHLSGPISHFLGASASACKQRCRDADELWEGMFAQILQPLPWVKPRRGILIPCIKMTIDSAQHTPAINEHHGFGNYERARRYQIRVLVDI